MVLSVRWGLLVLKGLSVISAHREARDRLGLVETLDQLGTQVLVVLAVH